MPPLTPPRNSSHPKVVSFRRKASLVQRNARPFPTGALTISCWLAWAHGIELDADSEVGTTGPNLATILSYDEFRPDDGNRPRSAEYASIHISVPSNIEVAFAGVSTGSTGIDVSGDAWFHLAVTITPADPAHYQVQVIKNGGEQVVTRTIRRAATELRPDGKLMLAQRYEYDSGEQFLGEFAELLVWDHARPVADIKKDMGRLPSSADPGLQLYWSLGELPPRAEGDNLEFIPAHGDDFDFDFS